MADTCLITGGTGSLGQALVRRFLVTTDWAIRVFSRDEQKQDAMKREVANDRVRYLLGDIRDWERVRRALRGCRYVIHAAALKIIPAGEYNPDEVIKTNVTGSDNVINAAIDCGVESLLCVSSDKAVQPVNLYGNTKACMEKLAVLANNSSGSTKIGVVRYGNVIGSRGSILTILRRMSLTGHLSLTDARMTRFWISLPEAAELCHKAVEWQQGGLIYVPDLRSAYLADIYHELYPKLPVTITGLRPGEKIHELLSNSYEETTDDGWALSIGQNWIPDQIPISSGDAARIISAAKLLTIYQDEVNDALAA